MKSFVAGAVGSISFLALEKIKWSEPVTRNLLVKESVRLPVSVAEKPTEVRIAKKANPLFI
jgi:hypothetical protein